MTRSIRLWAACAVIMTALGCTSADTAKREALANGDKYFAAGKFNEAVVEYRNALRRDSRFGEARWKLAETYEKQKNAAAAFREYVRAADLLQDRADVQVKAGTYLLVAQQFDDAKTRAELALKRDPRNLDALILRANAMAGLKDVSGAIRDIEEALKTDPTEGRIYSTLGTLRLIQGERPEAEAAFKKAIEVSPTSIEARLALANFYWSATRFADVEKVLTEARAIDPAHLMLNRMLAAFYIGTRRMKEAEAPLKTLAERSGDTRAQLALADYYVGVQRPADAVPTLQQLTRDTATFAPATLRLAQLERDGGRRQAAVQLLDSVIKKEPRNVDALITRASWQLYDGDRTAAIATAQQATTLDPGSARAQFLLGQALSGTPDTAGAIKSLTEALKLNPRIVSAQIILSRLQLATGNKDAAVQFATQAKKAQPANPDAQLALARSLLAQGNTQQAEPEVRALIAKYPDHPRSHNLLATLLLAKNDPAGARAAWGRALAKDPNSIEALEGLLALDARANALPAAVTRIEQRVATNPGNASLQMVAARTYAAAGQTANTEKALQKVLSVQPDNLDAYLLLGRAYAREKRLDEALAQFDAAARRDAAQVGAATMAAMIVQAQNKTAEAQKRYEAIVAAHPDASVAANNLAWMYAENGGNLDLALQLAQSAKAQQPDSPAINDTLGWIYYKKNLAALAIPPLEASLAKSPNNASYRLHLGLAYAKAGQMAKARETLEMALRLNPHVEGADLARQALADFKG